MEKSSTPNRKVGTLPLGFVFGAMVLSAALIIGKVAAYQAPDVDKFGACLKEVATVTPTDSPAQRVALLKCQS